MDAGKCFFAKESPAVEIRGGLVFILPAGGHCEIAVSPHIARKFAVRLRGLLDEFDAENRVTRLRA